MLKFNLIFKTKFKLNLHLYKPQSFSSFQKLREKNANYNDEYLIIMPDH